MRDIDTGRAVPAPAASPPEPTVRRATSADLPAIVGIYNQAVADRQSTCDLSALSPSDRIDWLAAHTGPHGVWVVPGDDERVLAWASLSPFSTKECFRDIGMTATYVDREHQGRGLGKFLRGYVIEQARRHDFHSVIARIWATNGRSVALSHEFGFVEVGRLMQVACLDDERVDVILFQKILRR